MDDTARLASELQDKLAELDGKVAAYQRDMLTQFRRHMDDCLKNYPPHVSDEVSRVIAASMSKYPALNPARRNTADLLTRSDDDHDDAGPKAWDGRKSPPPILYHTSGTPKEGPRSPHQREKEFQGLFTPSYLPLLDSSFRTPQSPPISLPATAPTFAVILDNVTKVEEPKQTEPVTQDEPRPVSARSVTEPSKSSVDPLESGSKRPKSALRRSSTGSTTKSISPRRVRFDFQGMEVLPSSSPQAPVDILAMTGGAEFEQPTPPQAEPEPEVAVADTSAIVVNEDESSSYIGTLSLLDVEGEEDSVPRPRKVSSTQALQALSRSPLDAVATWTVVNPDPDDVPKTNGGDQAETSGLALKMKPGAIVVPESTIVDTHRIDELLGSPIEELERYNDEDDASDDDFLSMSTRFPKKSSPPVAPAPIVKPASLTDNFHETSFTHSTRPLGDFNVSAGEDVLFDLDEEANFDGVKKYLTEDEEDETPISERLRPRLIPTADQPTPPLEHDDAAALPPVSPSSALFGGTVGSYKGNPLIVNPINNTELYDEIAAMDDVHFVMGSIDGRSGIDPADMNSYRATLARHVAGTTPRSFTERLALEEAMEQRGRRGA